MSYAVSYSVSISGFILQELGIHVFAYASFLFDLIFPVHSTQGQCYGRGTWNEIFLC